MDPRLLQFFEEELTHVRRMAEEFSTVHPEVAERLLIAQDPPDPYVQSLMDGFAYLAARVQLQLSSEYPQFVESVLQAVFPHYLTPKPAMIIAAFEPEWNDVDLARAPVIKAGTQLQTRLESGKDRVRCQFTTAHDVPIVPLRLIDARYHAQDLEDLNRDWIKPTSAVAAIRLRFQATAGLTVRQIEADRMILHLRPKEDLAALLYESLLTQGAGVVVQPTSRRPAHARLGAEAIRPMGMTESEAMLPKVDSVLSGFRLLQEYFCFPARFLFVELSGLRPAFAACGETETEIDIVIPLRRAYLRLEGRLKADCFALHCTPAINLFPVKDIVVEAKPGQTEHLVVPDKTKLLEYEVYSVDSVVGRPKVGIADEERHRFHPVFFGDAGHSRGAGYFSSRRAPRPLTDQEHREGAASTYRGGDVYLTLDRQARMDGIERVQVGARCTNRHVPGRRPELEFETGDIGVPISRIHSIAKTEARPPPDLGRDSWRAIGQLSLNLRSLLGDEKSGARVLRELLRLYVPPGDDVLMAQVEALRQVTCSHPEFRRIRTGPGDRAPIAYARGLTIRLEFDESAFREGATVCTLGLVLDQFLSRYVSINSFIETEIHTQRGLIHRCPVRTGKRSVL